MALSAADPGVSHVGGGGASGIGEGLEDDDDDDWSSDDGGGLLNATLQGDALARSLVNTLAVNELGLVRSEVRRLRNRIERVENEKEDMAEDFRNTTKILLNRIKELEGELSGAQTRPQTSAVIERIEVGAKGRGNSVRPSISSVGTSPQILTIEEEPAGKLQQTDLTGNPANGPNFLEQNGETICGNCRKSIPSGNVLAHSVNCYRFNFYCGSCDEVIPLQSKDQHMREWMDPQRLIDAVSKRDADVVQRMLGHSADICNSVHPTTRDTAMHAAARIFDEELVAFLTAHGLDIDPLNQQGETPLLVAASTAVDDPAPPASPPSTQQAPSAAGPSPAVRLLVELGANINQLNYRGESSLMLLCRRGVACTATYLVEMRADTEVCNPLGDTSLQIAQRQGHQETVLALCSAGVSLRTATPACRSPSPECESFSGGLANRTRSISPMQGALQRNSLFRSPPTQTVTRNAQGGYPPLPKERRSSSSRARSHNANSEFAHAASAC